MGAVLGVAAYGRTQEKISGAENGGMQQPNNTFGSTSPSGFETPSSVGFGDIATSNPIVRKPVIKPTVSN
jgi:hypothetical protein